MKNESNEINRRSIFHGFLWTRLWGGRAIVSLGLAAGIAAGSGCSSLSRGGSLSSRGKSNPPAALGQVETDPYGRALPGTKTPLGMPVTEAGTEITDQTRCHVALAMGEMLESVGNLEEAQAQYEQSLKNDPKSLNAGLALARVYARQGRPDAALKVYQNIEKHHRRSAALFNDKGLLLADQKDWAGAIGSLRTAVKLEPSQSKYHNNLGMILAASGKYEESYKEFREAVGPGPAHYNVALMLLQADRPVEARDHLERALAAMPTLEKAQQMLMYLDGRTSGAAVASNEREVAVDLPAEQEPAASRPAVPANLDGQVEPAEATEPVEAEPVEPEPIMEPEAPAEPQSAAKLETPNEPQNPWSRRWVPPKWLR